MKLDWFIYISPRKDTPMKESHQSFRNGDLKQNKLAENFAETYTHVHIYPKPDKFPGDPPTHRYLSYIYVQAIKEDSMVVAIFRHYWSPYIKTYRKTPTFQR